MERLDIKIIFHSNSFGSFLRIVAFFGLRLASLFGGLVVARELWRDGNMGLCAFKQGIDTIT